MRFPAGEEKAPEQRLGLGAVELRHAHDAIERRSALIQLVSVLREVADLHAVPEPVAPADDGLEQRRLPAAVRPDEPHVLAALERQRYVFEENTAVDGDRFALEVE